MYALGPTPASAFGPETKLPRVLVWFRRDLRVDDNPALTAALDLAHEVVRMVWQITAAELCSTPRVSLSQLEFALCFLEPQIPVYIYAPEEEGQFQPGRCSRWWLNSSLRSLDADLRALGSRLLCFRAGESRVALAALVRDLGAQGVVFNHLYDPISMVRDNEVKGTLASLGVFCRSFNGDVLREPWEVMGPDGEPLSTFTSFWATHCAAEAAAPLPPPLPAPTALPPVSPSLAAMGTGVDLGIMTPEEELSNSQLEYHVSL